MIATSTKSLSAPGKTSHAARVRKDRGDMVAKVGATRRCAALGGEADIKGALRFGPASLPQGQRVVLVQNDQVRWVGLRDVATGPEIVTRVGVARAKIRDGAVTVDFGRNTENFRHAGAVGEELVQLGNLLETKLQEFAMNAVDRDGKFVAPKWATYRKEGRQKLEAETSFRWDDLPRPWFGFKDLSLEGVYSALTTIVNTQPRAAGCPICGDGLTACERHPDGCVSGRCGEHGFMRVKIEPAVYSHVEHFRHLALAEASWVRTITAPADGVFSKRTSQEGLAEIVFVGDDENARGEKVLAFPKAKIVSSGSPGPVVAGDVLARVRQGMSFRSPVDGLVEFVAEAKDVVKVVVTAADGDAFEFRVPAVAIERKGKSKVRIGDEIVALLAWTGPVKDMDETVKAELIRAWFICQARRRDGVTYVPGSLATPAVVRSGLEADVYWDVTNLAYESEDDSFVQFAAAACPCDEEGFVAGDATCIDVDFPR